MVWSGNAQEQLMQGTLSPSSSKRIFQARQLTSLLSPVLHAALFPPLSLSSPPAQIYNPHHRSPLRPNNPIAAFPLRTLLLKLSSSHPPSLIPVCLGSAGVRKASSFSGPSDLCGEDDGSCAGITRPRMFDTGPARREKLAPGRRRGKDGSGSSSDCCSTGSCEWAGGEVEVRSWEKGTLVWFVWILNWARRRRRRSVSACFLYVTC